MLIKTIFAGFGGQGVLSMGLNLAQAAMAEGKNVTYLPAYGVEVRGGTANCTVVVSDTRIGSPIINNPMSACVFNRPSLDKFGSMIRKGGILLINSSLIDVTSGRDDITELLIPANDIAMKAGSPKVINMVMLAAFVEATGVVSFETLTEMLRQKLGTRKKDLLEINYKAFEEGRKFGRGAKVSK